MRRVQFFQVRECTRLWSLYTLTLAPGNGKQTVKRLSMYLQANHLTQASSLAELTGSVFQLQASRKWLQRVPRLAIQRSVWVVMRVPVEKRGCGKLTTARNVLASCQVQSGRNLRIFNTAKEWERDFAEILRTFNHQSLKGSILLLILFKSCS